MSFAACSKASFSCSVLVGILRLASMWCILLLRGLYKKLKQPFLLSVRARASPVQVVFSA
jgi:hypothetical protein